MNKIIALAFINFVTSVFGSIHDADWLSFKIEHGKQYSSRREELHRVNIFKENKRFVDEHNLNFSLGLVNFSMKMNQFSDLTDVEFRSLFLSPLQRDSSLTAVGGVLGQSEVDQLSTAADSALPKEADWRPYLSPAKTQGPCGSCWAFAATGAIEGQLKKNRGVEVRLSEQELLDCSSFNQYGNSGCSGGLMEYAFNYILKNRGIDTEEAYPYEGSVRRCRFKRGRVGAQIHGYRSIEPGDEQEMQRVVAFISPVSVGLDADGSSFRFYSTGIYSKEGCGRMGVNHAALVVGYGEENGEDYWLVRNSWGPTWGQGGYFKTARNKGDQCGISSLASYPLL